MESQNPNRPWIIVLWVVLISILVGVFYFWIKLVYCNNNIHCVFTRWDREIRREFEENRMKELNKNNEQEQLTLEENKETEESKETINQEEINKNSKSSIRKLCCSMRRELCWKRPRLKWNWLLQT